MGGLIMPSAIDPGEPRDQTTHVQIVRPVGRFIWTRAVWPASLAGASTADGMISRSSVRKGRRF
jgi:hypothetical protein